MGKIVNRDREESLTEISGECKGRRFDKVRLVAPFQQNLGGESTAIYSRNPGYGYPQ